MEKTVQVVDEAGVRYEATWVKRAKGLVKNGRARFIDENTICLACPPKTQNINSEDMKMTNTENLNQTQNTEMVAVEATAAVTEKYSLAYALDQLERIANDTSAVMEALKTIASLENEGTPTGGSAEALAKAAAEVIRCRETTNQKLIEFYRGMVDDLKPKKESCGSDRDRFLGCVKECSASLKPGAEAPDYARLWKEIQG